MLHRPASLALFLVAMIFIALNIYSSQSVNNLFFRYAADENGHAVEYLRAIQSLPQFKPLYRWYGTVANQDLYDSVYYANIVRSGRIAQLEQVLTKNPSAPGVLSALATLYRLQGDDTQADQYRYRALQIDPGLE